MKFNVLQFVRNTQGAYSAEVVATYDNVDGAKVKYHQLLASLHNASDVLYASARIVNEYGNEVSGYFEIVDHKTEGTTESET